MKTDLLIAGAGPAGLALAAEAVGRGLSVTVVAPAPEAPWVPTYSSWADELPATVPVAQRWDRVTVRTGRVHVVERAYALVDGPALQRQCWSRAAGARVVVGKVNAVETHGAGVTAHLDDGRELEAAVAVTATGSAVASAWQTAYGEFAELSGLDGSELSWMDFSHDFDDGEAAPSFLYALPFADGTWLVEETTLVRVPAVPLDLLQRRLHQRLAARGVTLRRVTGAERVAIPMDARPSLTGPSLAFGAAAGMVHPATGFQVARAVGAAPRVADALVSGLARSPSEALAAARSAAWPGTSLRTHAVYRYGAGALGKLGMAHTRVFFDTFFQSEPSFVRGFLGDTLSPAALVRGMADLFRRWPSGLRLRVLSAGNPAILALAVWPPTVPPSEANP